MKKLLLILTLISVYTQSFSQSATLNNIMKIRLTDAGSMLDQYNDVNGYYFLY